MADIGTVLKKEGKFPRKLFLQKKDYMRAWKQWFKIEINHRNEILAIAWFRSQIAIGC